MENGIITPTRRLIISILIIAMIMIVGSIGFMIIEHMTPINSLYMAVITVSTVGFGEVAPLSEEGRLFVVFLIIFSVIAVTTAASSLGQVIIEGQLRSVLGRRKMKSKIKNLSEHHIIAGYGRVGRQVADAYTQRKVPFIVVENNNDAINRLEADGHIYIEGEAIEDEALIRAGVERAKVLVSTLPSESDNVYMALSAREMNKDLHIICRADHPDGEKKLKRAGANHVVSPHILGGMRMAMASLRPNVVDFMQMTTMSDAGLGIEEIVLPTSSRFVGKSLIDSKIKADYGITVIGIRRGDTPLKINPSPTESLNGNDILLLIGSTDNLEKFSDEMA